MQFLQRRMRPRFEASDRASIGRPLPVRLLMDLPPVAELRTRLIAFGGWHPERVRELDSSPEPRIRLRETLTSLAQTAGKVPGVRSPRLTVERSCCSYRGAS
jgi:hypothetical protein